MSIAACGGAKPEKGDAAAVAPGGDTAAAATAPADPRVAIADTNRIKGNPDAKVWLIMASDFQCPACKYWHDSASAEIMRDYVASGKVRFAYTNFPLDELHPNARAAAEAAMCVAAQGKFWAIHEALFAKQPEWAPLPDPIPAFRKLALEAGADTVAWNKCLTDDVMMPLIEGDQGRGRANGVNQTPYFFVGQQRVGGAIPAAQLRPMIDAALAQAGGTSR
jgi:protein-disulfide isomerase